MTLFASLLPRPLQERRMAQREALVAMESERARRLSLDKEAESQLALLRL